MSALARSETAGGGGDTTPAASPRASGTSVEPAAVAPPAAAGTRSPSRWFSAWGFDHVLVCRVADDLGELPGSPLAGLGMEERERVVKRVLALVEERGYIVERKDGR